MNIYHVRHGSILPLGKQGENMARKIQFDISRWIGTFGPGTVQLLHQRSGDDAPYPVAVEKDGTQAIWTVTNADTAAAGTGRAELQYYVGDALAKSETWMTKVLPALGDASETPPEAQHGWVDQVLQAGTVATEAAEKAANAAVRQPIVGGNSNWWTWDLEAGAYVDTGIYSGGDAPYIGDNGNWYVGQTDTGVAATGPAGPALAVTNTAAVGQTVKITAVDEKGQPTELEAVDMPEQVQADWNQNDSTAADYVKNRPFYTGDPVETVVFEEQTANFAVDKPFVELPSTEDEETNKLYESIFDGATIRIVWDGEIYDCVTVGGLAGNFTLANGSGGNNEPFFLSLREFVMLAAESGEHTFSITYIEANVYKIEEKYLPDTVIKSNYAAYTMPAVNLDGVFDLTYFSNETSGGYSKTCTTEQWDDISKLLLGARANYMVYATSRQVESCLVYSNYKLKILGSRISETGSFKVNVSLLEYDVNNETLTVTYCADKASIP